MATPVRRVYSVGAGQPIHGGRYPGGRLFGNVTLAAAIAAGSMSPAESALSGAVDLAPVLASGALEGHIWPAWRAAIAPFTWGIVSTNTMSSVDPSTSPDIVPAGADWWTRGLQGALSWCGAVWDDDLLDFRIPNKGGHTDDGGNEGYGCDCSVDAPAIRMMFPPSGSLTSFNGIPRSPIVTLGTEGGDPPAPGVVSAYYNDDGTGQLRVRASHTYRTLLYVPGVGDLLTRMGSMHYSGNGNVKKIHSIDRDTGTCVMLCDYSAIDTNANSCGMAAWDPDRQSIWITNRITDAKLLEIKPFAGWTVTQRDVHTRLPSFGDALEYAPSLQALIGVARGQVAAVWRVGANSYVDEVPSVSGSYSAGFGIRGSFDGFGSCWCPDLGPLGALAIYQQNSSHTTEISICTPSSSDASQPWTRSVLPVDPSNSVVPPVSDPEGLMNRFVYSERLKCFLLWNEYNQAIYAFAIQ